MGQYAAVDPGSTAALFIFTTMGIDLAGLANQETQKTIRQRIQSGTAIITNRGVISGCTVSNGGTPHEQSGIFLPRRVQRRAGSRGEYRGQ
jgi:hypothetical protein